MAVDGMPSVTGRELLMTAMDMEAMNAKLYAQLSNKLKDPDAINLFEFLAKEEEKHRSIFWKKLSDQTEILDNQALGDHIQVLLFYVKNMIYDPETIQEKLRQLRGIESIFEMAISMELDHILYYQEIKDSVIQKERYLIDEIIDEERRHFLRLVQYRKAKGF